MVCDSKRNLDRFHRIVGMELPDNGSLLFRCSGQILRAGASRRSTVRRSRIITGMLPLSRFDPEALIQGQNFLGRQGWEMDFGC